MLWRRASQLLSILCQNPSVIRVSIEQHRTNATTAQLRDHAYIMVELRKRKTPPPAPVRPAKKASAPKGKKAASEKTVIEQATEAVSEAAAAVTETVTEAIDTAKDSLADATNGANKPVAASTSKIGPPKVGDTIDLTSFGGEVETQDGKKTTLATLVAESKSSVVLFTYPKASTPGCP